jgi:myosin heavy subunit
VTGMVAAANAAAVHPAVVAAIPEAAVPTAGQARSVVSWACSDALPPREAPMAPPPPRHRAPEPSSCGAPTMSVAAPTAALTPPRPAQAPTVASPACESVSVPSSRGSGVPPEVTAELMRLRRKLSDLTADNSLLTQNFLMVQARHREVSAQRDDERELHKTELACAKDAADHRLACVRGAHTSILRSEVKLLEFAISRQRATAAAAALGVCVRSRFRSRLGLGLARWMRAVQASTHAELERVAASDTALQTEAGSLRASRRVDAARHAISLDEGRARMADLSHAVRRWRLVIVLFDYDALEKRSSLMRAARATEQAEADARLEERQGSLEAERSHAEALSREMTQLAEHARGCEQSLQKAKLETFTTTREKDALAAKLAETELQVQLTRSQLETVSDERRRLEASRDSLQTERDQMLNEWRKAEAEARVLNAKSSERAVNEQSHTARLLAEVTELRRRLAAVDSSRERERHQLMKATHANVHLQGQLQQQRIQQVELMSLEQRREVSTVFLAQARLDADATLALNAELHAFASKVNVEPPEPRSLSRSNSPLRPTSSPVARSPLRPRRV